MKLHFTCRIVVDSEWLGRDSYYGKLILRFLNRTEIKCVMRKVATCSRRFRRLGSRWQPHCFRIMVKFSTEGCQTTLTLASKTQIRSINLTVSLEQCPSLLDCMLTLLMFGFTSSYLAIAEQSCGKRP